VRLVPSARLHPQMLRRTCAMFGKAGAPFAKHDPWVASGKVRGVCAARVFAGTTADIGVFSLNVHKPRTQTRRELLKGTGHLLVGHAANALGLHRGRLGKAKIGDELRKAPFRSAVALSPFHLRQRLPQVPPRRHAQLVDRPHVLDAVEAAPSRVHAAQAQAKR
jgi:hypothetical protein